MGIMDYYNTKKHRNKNKKPKKDKNKTKIKAKNNNKDTSLSIREGDWLCQFCFNLNFSFRTFCNRCKAPK